VTRAWRAELVKIATVRGQWLSVLIATLAIPLFSFLVVATGGLTTSQSSTSGAATGALAGLLAFGMWAAILTAGEYAKGTMITSLSIVPRRAALYPAKLGALAGTATVGALVSVVVGLLLVMAVRAPGPHGIGNPASLIVVVLTVVAVVVMGVSIGVLTRSPSASIVIVAAVLVLPKLAAGLLGGLQPWVVGASPSTVVSEVVGGVSLPSDQTFPSGSWAAVLAMLGVAAVVAGAGALVFSRRDG
jgi:hypothetical protein